MITTNISIFSNLNIENELLNSFKNFDDPKIHLYLHFYSKNNSVFTDIFFDSIIMIKENYSIDDFDNLICSENKYPDLFNKFKEMKEILNNFSIKATTVYKNSILFNKIKECLFNEYDISFLLKHITKVNYLKFYFFTPDKTFLSYVSFFDGNYDLKIGNEKNKIVSLEEITLILQSSFLFENKTFPFNSYSNNDQIYNFHNEIFVFMEKFRNSYLLENF